MEMEHALDLVREVCEEHGAKCYLLAYDTISEKLAEALKPIVQQPQSAIDKSPCASCHNSDCPTNNGCADYVAWKQRQTVR